MSTTRETNIFRKTIFGGLAFVLIASLSFSCKSDKPSEKDIVKKPEQLEDRIKRNLTSLIEYASENGGKITDSNLVSFFKIIGTTYANRDHDALWSVKGEWLPIGDSLFDFIRGAKKYGLFPSDYHYSSLSAIQQQLLRDSLARKDAALWSRADIMLTDALFAIARDLKRGRLPYDSLNIRADTPVLDDPFYFSVLDSVTAQGRLATLLETLEPQLPGYVELKNGIGSYLDSANFKKYTYLFYPYKDSIAFFNDVRNRLLEEEIVDSLPPGSDTSLLRKAIAKYQAKKKIKATGRINETTVNLLNDTEWERFKKIAITLDKYKLMVDTMPETYIWVNIPSYYLTVYDADTLLMDSKVIVGTPKNKTPELTSAVSNFITYPQWTVPYSIIFKEMLPAIQKDTNYLKKQNLMVVDKNDSVIPPSKINWSKLSKNKFPYLIRQREGDDNSLGVIKFNFRNKYSVYLHDTNARWLFSKSQRSLSHGCVRVQDWRELAHFLVRNDTIKYHPDTLASWIVRQEKHVVSGFKKVPVFIRYFTSEGKYGKIKFFDDIYGEDRILAERYFQKPIL